MNGTITGPKWAVYDPTKFWLTDTCAGGAWSETVEEAVWFDGPQEALAALIVADIDGEQIVLCRVR